MDELIGFLAEAAAAAAAGRGNADPQAAEKLRKRIEETAAASSGSAGKAVTPAQSRPAASSPKKTPPVPSAVHAPNVAAAFRDRSSLLTALVAVEVLGVPPSLRPREMRGDAW